MSELLFPLINGFIKSQMVVACIIFVIGLVLLIKGGDWFVEGASGIAKKYHVPELIIGATIVSIGTTLPEVMVSSTASLVGSGDIAYGNAIGSIICNTALICAMVIAIRPAPVERKSLRIPVAFFFGAAAVYLVFTYLFGHFSRISGIILLLIFAFYMYINIRTAVKGPKVPSEEETESHDSLLKMIVFIVVGAAFIAIGSDFLVDNGMIIAKELGVPESVIALTVVALGTSLPELVTAITSLIKGHGALSLGNIIGANFIDLVLVSGIAPLLSPFDIPQEKTIAGMNASLIVDMPVMIAVMGIMTVPALLKGKLSRWQGITLLLIYVAFCTVQFIL